MKALFFGIVAAVALTAQGRRSSVSLHDFSQPEDAKSKKKEVQKEIVARHKDCLEKELENVEDTLKSPPTEGEASEIHHEMKELFSLRKHAKDVKDEKHLKEGLEKAQKALRRIEAGGHAGCTPHQGDKLRDAVQSQQAKNVEHQIESENAMKSEQVMEAEDAAERARQKLHAAASAHGQGVQNCKPKEALKTFKKAVAEARDNGLQGDPATQVEIEAAGTGSEVNVAQAEADAGNREAHEVEHMLQDAGQKLEKAEIEVTQAKHEAGEVVHDAAKAKKHINAADEPVEELEVATEPAEVAEAAKEKEVVKQETNVVMDEGKKATDDADTARKIAEDAVEKVEEVQEMDEKAKELAEDAKGQPCEDSAVGRGAEKEAANNERKMQAAKNAIHGIQAGAGQIEGDAADAKAKAQAAKAGLPSDAKLHQMGNVGAPAAPPAIPVIVPLDPGMGKIDAGALTPHGCKQLDKGCEKEQKEDLEIEGEEE